MRTYLLAILSFICLFSKAQNKINSYQYWFDDDYDKAVKTIITPTTNFTLNTQINTSSILQGIHTFHFKCTDDSARSSILSSSFFYKLPILANSNITDWQYWFDVDFANAITQPASDMNAFTLADNISTGNLCTGLHVLQIRFKDNKNLWSSASSQFMYKVAANESNTIIAYQYWFDNNFSAAVQQNITPGISYSVSSPINTATLLDGLHILQVRFKDNKNLWSSASSQFMYKVAANESNTIIAYQYWFDNNFSAAVQQNITPGISYSVSTPINTTSLLDGLHVIQVRSKDIKNSWSITSSQYFYKAAANINNAITRIQYWFDDNFAAAMQQVVTPTATFILSQQINATVLLDGLHGLSVRFSDANGKWSSTSTNFFYKEKNSTIAENKITAYRYWFDERDSIMNLVDLAPIMNPLIMNQPIAADGMDSGRHVIHFQFKDNKGNWSMISSDSTTVIAKAIFTFNGNGNWSNPANWVNKIIPPLYISGKYKIFINPVDGGRCILDVSQHITEGAIITIPAGKSLVILGNLQINQ
ncbi:MAG: hypothetical protein ACOYKE_03000 [Ferruginibacter sp.]